MKQTDENAVIVLRRLREHFKDDAIGREVLSYTINRLKGLIENPTVEQKHGHWYIDEQKNIWGDYVNCQVCSVCNKRNIDCDKKSAYCPNCGAKMDEVTE